MKIDTAKIENFESMTAEEKLAALLELDLETGDNGAELLRLKTALSKANGEAAEFKRKLHEKMSDEEKAKEAAAAAQKDLEDKYNALLRESNVSKTTAKYMELGMSRELAVKTAEAALDGNEDVVFANLTAFKADFEKSVRASALDNTPKPGHKGAGSTSVTPEQFKKMGYSELVKLKAENPELYAELKNA